MFSYTSGPRFPNPVLTTDGLFHGKKAATFSYARRATGSWVDGKSITQPSLSLASWNDAAALLRKCRNGWEYSVKSNAERTFMQTWELLRWALSRTIDSGEVRLFLAAFSSAVFLPLFVFSSIHLSLSPYLPPPLSLSPWFPSDFSVFVRRFWVGTSRYHRYIELYNKILCFSA